MEQSGFGFDKKKGVVTAPNDVWDGYIAVRSNASLK